MFVFDCDFLVTCSDSNVVVSMKNGAMRNYAATFVLLRINALGLPHTMRQRVSSVGRRGDCAEVLDVSK
jgi:hypothetical protein